MWEALANIAASPNLAQNGLTLVVLALIGVLIYVIRFTSIQSQQSNEQTRALLRECNESRESETRAKLELSEALTRQTMTLENLGKIIERSV